MIDINDLHCILAVTAEEEIAQYKHAGMDELIEALKVIVFILIFCGKKIAVPESPCRSLETFSLATRLRNSCNSQRYAWLFLYRGGGGGE